MHLPLPSSLPTKEAWGQLVAAALPAVASMVGGAIKPKTPKVDNPTGGMSTSAAMAATSGGSAQSATYPHGSTAKPKSTSGTHAPGADEAFTPNEYGQPPVPQLPTVAKPPKLSSIQPDTAINAVSMLGPIAYDMGRKHRNQRDAEEAEIEHLQNSLTPPKTGSSILADPVGAGKDYIDGMGHALLDASQDAQRPRPSLKHIAQPPDRRTNV